MTQLISRLEGLAGDHPSPEKTALLCTNLGRELLKVSFGEPGLNAEYAIRYLEEALLLWPEVHEHERALTMYTLGNTYTARLTGDPAENVEEGIRYYRQALAIWTKAGAPAYRALAMTALGGALTVRIKGDPAENQEEALSCLNQALAIRTREAAPLDWAATLYALGNIYTRRTREDPSGNLEKAIDCFGDVLSVWTKELVPGDWAMTRYALANAYRRRIEGNVAENIETAIELLADALSIWRKDTDPLNWATTIFVLGNAYAERHTGNPADNLETAIACVNQALLVWTREAIPMSWAMAMNILGQLHGVRIKGDPAENREKAVEYLNETLAVWKKEVVPWDWAHTVNALGQAYSQRIKGDPMANREKATACYLEALTVRRKEIVPREWARTMHALGKAYRDRGMEGDVGSNEMAIDCFEQVLSVRKKEIVPMDWAATMAELGVAYAAHLEEDQALRELKAINCLNQALSIWTRDVVPMSWAEVQYRLGNIHAERKAGVVLENYREAVRCYRAALSVVAAETRPQLYTLARYGLGFSLLHQARLQNDKELLEEALEAMTEALKHVSVIHSEIADPKARRNYLRRSISMFDVAVHFLLEERRYANALYWMELMRSRSLLEDVNLEQVRPRNEAATEPVRQYWELCHDLRGLRAALAMNKENSTTQGGSGSNFRQQELYAALKEDLRRQKALFKELTILDPEYVNLINPEPLTEVELFQLLSQTGSAAVECFFRRESADLHFLVAYPTDSGVAYTHLLKDLKPVPLEEALGGFVDSFRTGGASILSSLDTLLAVTGHLMEPVASFLAKIGTHRIYLSPHAFLHAFPLHAAFLPDTKRFFIEDFEVCYTPSLTLSYRLFRSEVRSGERALALFYAPDDRALSYGEQEYRFLLDAYRTDRIVHIQGSKATFASLVEASKAIQRELSLVELICHGRRTAEDATLHLADGDISHVEMMMQLDFSGLPLAVLAACESGRSDEWNLRYEEYLALDGVFLQMGARGVVSSFYPINDQGTWEVMREFHRQMKDGMQPVGALHEAQRKVLKEGFVRADSSGARGRMPKQEDLLSGPGPGAHPYYWAFLKYSGTF